MPKSLLIIVRFCHGRYHGAGDWPPAPARLYQALVAGAAKGQRIAQESHAALAWLERLDPPVVAAPPAEAGQSLPSYVPNNDLDAVGGDPARTAEIRTLKTSTPRLFDHNEPLVYFWTAEDTRWNDVHAKTLVGLTEGLYQLGRGVDPAFADAEILDFDTAEERLGAHGGVVHRPAPSGRRRLSCRTTGSLAGLIARFAAGRRRFAREGRGRATITRFARPPRAPFRTVAYDAPPARLLLELRWSGDDSFRAWSVTDASALVERVRDAAIQRLEDAVERDADVLGNGCGHADIGRFLKGSLNATDADKARRVRFLPLPSIGHAHADPDIRRLLVEVPQECPIRAASLDWALNGMPLTRPDDQETGELFDHVRLVPTETHDMLRHYGIDAGRPRRRWHTVTPAALPQARRRRIDPARRLDEAKGGAERAQEETTAAGAVLHALRHAGITARPSDIRIQREPWGAKGARAEEFAHGTRFSKHALWHVELTFPEPIAGPLVIGDGRYLGLGLMAPVPAGRDLALFALAADPLPALAEREPLLHAVRRALMSLASDTRSDAVLALFSGHLGASTGPARPGHHGHAFLFALDRDGDGRLDQVGVVAPWRADRSHAPPPDWLAERFTDVVARLETVRAGPLGVLRLAPRPETETVPLAGPARDWRSVTDYRPTRHPRKRQDPAPVVTADLLEECRRRGLPRPAVEAEIRAGPRGGVAARVTLAFPSPVKGPLLLGRDAHRGGGLMVPAE